MSVFTKWMDATFYPEHTDNWDDILFRKILSERINAESSCLDYGAGRGNVEQMGFRGIAKFIAGVDPDPAVLENPHLDEAKVLDLEKNVIPYEDNTFDLVYSDNVMEHVQNPEPIFREVYRILKPGGLFLSKTPNKWHYMPIVARSTPTAFHKFYNKMRGRKEVDTFPTTYMCNTKGAVVEHALKCGFQVKDIRFVEGRPEYLRLTAFTYSLGFLYERLVNSIPFLAAFRCVIIFELHKKA